MSDAASPFELLPAEEVERLLPSYSQVSFLAQGGMAAVYQGVQTSLDRPVAIKILPREFGSDESFRLRFEAEGKAMAKLNHPNLVSIFDFGEVDDLLYLVMEFVEGKTLHQHAYETKIEELEAVELCQSIASGLAHAHEHGILHRDIKPANVLLDQRGNPKLGDFGLAEGEERADGDDLVFGTPGYTAPEVLANPAAADEKADVFALGVLLHELLTGALPEQPYQYPSRLVQSDPRIDSMITSAIHQDPAMRCSARQFAENLKHLHDQLKSAPRRKLATKTAGASAIRTLKVTPATPRETSTIAPVLATGDLGGTVNQPGAAPAPTRTSRSRSSSSLPLVRNFIIILALLGCIFGAWKALEQKKATLALEEAKEEERQERAKRKRDAEAKRAAIARNTAKLENKDSKSAIASPDDSPPLQKPQEIVPNPLTPREQLEELRPSLLAGERTQFPEGTSSRGSARYFFIEDALTWYEAIEFAERHGAHLAVTPKKSDLQWLAREIPTEDDIWLGAGAVSRSDWAWFDDSVAFELKKPNTSTGIAAMVTKIGILKSRDPSVKLPFFIQWNEDGKQPGSRELDLTKLAETVTGPNPIWPPGTLSYEDRRYLILARDLSQAEAAAIASKAGGSLAVASNELEASYLREITEESGLPSLWLGGEKKNATWRWLTNEPWTFAKWEEGFPLDNSEASALQTTEKGWRNTDPYFDCPGFIIEWSDDAKDAPEIEEDPNPEALLEVSELRSRAQKLLQNEKAKIESRLKDNFEAQGMAMRQWLRSIPKEDAAQYQELYDSYVKSVIANDNQLPNPLNSPVAASAEDAAKILNRHFAQQEEAEEKLRVAAERFRVSYARRIGGMITDLEEKGLASQISALEKELEAAGTDGRDFLVYLGIKKEEGYSSTGTDEVGIISAKYGWEDLTMDVSEIVRERIKGNGSVVVSRSSFGGSDPAPQRKKSLSLSFIVDGQTHSSTFAALTEVRRQTLLEIAAAQKSN